MVGGRNMSTPIMQSGTLRWWLLHAWKNWHCKIRTPSLQKLGIFTLTSCTYSRKYGGKKIFNTKNVIVCEVLKRSHPRTSTALSHHHDILETKKNIHKFQGCTDLWHCRNQQTRPFWPFFAEPSANSLADPTHPKATENIENSYQKVYFSDF